MAAMLLLAKRTRVENGVSCRVAGQLNPLKQELLCGKR